MVALTITSLTLTIFLLFAPSFTIHTKELLYRKFVEILPAATKGLEIRTQIFYFSYIEVSIRDCDLYNAYETKLHAILLFSRILENKNLL